MSATWGRLDNAGVWPRPRRLGVIAALLIAVSAGVAVGAYRYTYVWTPMQRLYLSPYTRSWIVGSILSTGRYKLLHLIGPGRTRLALEAEITWTEDGQPTRHPSTYGRDAGGREIAWRVAAYPHRWVYALMRDVFYEQQQPLDLLRVPALAAACAFVLGLFIAVPADAARARTRRHGRRLKGPELVTPRQFHRRQRGDGMALALAPSWLGWLFRRRPLVRLSYALEPQHMLIMGDTGTGKSALIRQLLRQIQARGDTAIVYDPAGLYAAQFYDPDRGDVILNPLDARCPYWSPGDEVQDRSETTGLAAAFFQEQPGTNPFFVDAARTVFGELLTYRPTAQELVYWLTHRDELNRHVSGTPPEAMVDPNAPDQRGGVMATLNFAAQVLDLLPTADEVRGRWSASAWAEQRQGWIFLTSNAPARDRLRPLISLWLDLLVLRLQDQPGHRRRVWIFLDELAGLHRLPQLHAAMTENRKANAPLVLGFQGRSQIEMLYGQGAETILSQPATKVFLRISEARAAQWVSQTIGDVEIERVRESRSQGRDASQSYGLERQTEPLVMASEIGGLEDLRGYLKVLNFVVRLRLAFAPVVKRHPTFVARPLRPLPERPTATATAGEPDTVSGPRGEPEAGGPSPSQKPKTFFQ